MWSYRWIWRTQRGSSTNQHVVFTRTGCYWLLLLLCFSFHRKKWDDDHPWMGRSMLICIHVLELIKLFEPQLNPNKHVSPDQAVPTNWERCLFHGGFWHVGSHVRTMFPFNSHVWGHVAFPHSEIKGCTYDLGLHRIEAREMLHRMLPQVTSGQQRGQFPQGEAHYRPTTDQLLQCEAPQL